MEKDTNEEEQKKSILQVRTTTYFNRLVKSNSQKRMEDVIYYADRLLSCCKDLRVKQQLDEFIYEEIRKQLQLIQIAAMKSKPPFNTFSKATERYIKQFPTYLDYKSESISLTLQELSNYFASPEKVSIDLIRNDIMAVLDEIQRGDFNLEDSMLSLDESTINIIDYVAQLPATEENKNRQVVITSYYPEIIKKYLTYAREALLVSKKIHTTKAQNHLRNAIIKLSEWERLIENPRFPDTFYDSEAEKLGRLLGIKRYIEGREFKVEDTTSIKTTEPIPSKGASPRVKKHYILKALVNGGIYTKENATDNKTSKEWIAKKVDRDASRVIAEINDLEKNMHLDHIKVKGKGAGRPIAYFFITEKGINYLEILKKESKNNK